MIEADHPGDVRRHAVERRRHSAANGQPRLQLPESPVDLLPGRVDVPFDVRGVFPRERFGATGLYHGCLRVMTSLSLRRDSVVREGFRVDGSRERMPIVTRTMPITVTAAPMTSAASQGCKTVA